MIQLNLLPDIKLEYIKSKRSKRMVMVFSTISVAVSVALLLIMLSLTTLQKRHISDVDKDIKSLEKTLQDTPDLAKILTIQNQLNSLPGLYADRPVTGRLFPYLEQTTPTDVGIAHLILDFESSTLTIEGKSNSLESVNRYVDTLKFTSYKASDTVSATEGETAPAEEATDTTATDPKAFSEVVLSQFGRDALAASYTITLKFNPEIFNAAKNIKLSVPQTVSTRSETELPGSGVFNTETVQ